MILQVRVCLKTVIAFNGIHSLMHTCHLLVNNFHAYAVCANVQIIMKSWKKKKTQKYEYVLVGSTVKTA